MATRAGVEILRAGGNAFDAAVAVSAALGVVEPYASGVGGGGFWLLYRASDRSAYMLDGRERAPAAAHRHMYLGTDGKPVPGRSLDGPLAAAIPGVPAGLAYLSAHYGRLSLGRSLAPAIRLAREGFPVTEHYRRMAELRRDALRASPAAASIFLKEGEPPPLGHRVMQPELAHTLEIIAARGAAEFYRGALARRLIAGIGGAGGNWRLSDLGHYRVVLRKPLTGEYRGVRIISASPPSSGGVVLIQALNILSGYALDSLDPAARKHLLVEAMRRAYRDRAKYLGDPDQIAMPIERLIGAGHAARQRASISLGRATPSESLFLGGAHAREAANTSHFSIIDTEGNRVAATLSINYSFGSGFVVPGTGVLLNDEMDDFVSSPGVANVYGLVGSEANAIAPGKRPLSSMTPTFLETENRIGILGTPGGSRIISMVLLAVLDFAAGKPPESWVSLPRFHHQYLPDRIEYEPGAFSADEQAGLARRGHRLESLSQTYGNMQAIAWDKHSAVVRAASDPRGEGRAEVVVP